MSYIKGGVNQAISALESVGDLAFDAVDEVEDGVVAVGKGLVNVADSAFDMTADEARATFKRLVKFMRNRVDNLPDII